MIGLPDQADDAATPLDDEEKERLIPSYAALRAADNHDTGPPMEFVRS